MGSGFAPAQLPPQPSRTPHRSGENQGWQRYLHRLDVLAQPQTTAMRLAQLPVPRVTLALRSVHQKHY
jgi:hypothetical protein